MQSVAAALTMVRDDLFFLALWVAYYGGLLGRENCTVVNHGRSPEVAALAEGCNIIGLPAAPRSDFDVKRWRLLNHVLQGLRCYYDHVIVGDVDELVVVDPQHGGTLLDLLRRSPQRQVLTPVGLEVIHRRDREKDPIAGKVLGPRRHVRVAPHYAKPCILSSGVKIARGGHFSRSAQLNTPQGLYLLHLKFCDFDAYCDAMDRRNRIAEEIGGKPRDVAVGRHWFRERRGDDQAVFDGFADLEEKQGFDLEWVRRDMHDSWAPRGDTGFWEFARPDYQVQYRLPDRFSGIA
ncbi:glycosyltransferase family 2 protein [Cognatishimia sp. F0-27]|uniref:glycosyltransferase family 2 protein n=1 Tax=Cognatishimia sp. F0-27 TaxID=2816855 RepID=UPI001D0C4455|nr:glycosyltransferase family 2 protein [Cognatishimia sp. F0-27]MCC1491901.1 glycosyltransferase family 2 protein [Cognatishimia sp. F0-27]